MIPFSDEERARAKRLLDTALGDEFRNLSQVPGIEDIVINPNGAAYGYTGEGKLKMKTRFDRGQIGLIVNLAARFGGVIAEHNGVMSFSAHLPGRIRFQGGIEPRSVGGPYAVFRFLPQEVRSFDDYINDGVAPIEGKTTGLYSMDDEEETSNVGVGLPTMDCIAACLEARLTTVVFGETGSGKSSLLMSMANHPVVRRDRLVVFEDTEEMQFPYVDDVLQLCSAGIDMGELLKDGLRCRPDRILLGEARDGAIWVFIMAQYTSHSGGIITMHATNPKDFFDRVEQMIAQAGIDPASQRRVVMKALKRIVWIKGRPGGGRDIVGVYRPVGYDAIQGYKLERIDVPHRKK